MATDRTTEICTALEVVSRERLENDRELIRLGALNEAEAYRAGILNGQLYAARDLLRMHGELVGLLERAYHFCPVGELTARIEILLERAREL